jgi:predicted phosphodiesterase
MSYALLDENVTAPKGAPIVLLAGDTHGDFYELGELFRHAAENGAEAIIQCGDFGYGWRFTQEGLCAFSTHASELATHYNIHLYFLDGNHENFDALYSLPIDRETGLRPVLKGVTHLPRASTLRIGNTTFRAMGGAYSTDKGYRVEGLSWWEQETITDQDVENALLAGQADVFLSHDAPYGVVETAGLRRKTVEWGLEGAERSIANQRKVRKALDASGARLAFHGHLHQAYECWLDNGTDHGVRVVGLDRDGEVENYRLLAV